MRRRLWLVAALALAGCPPLAPVMEKLEVPPPAGRAGGSWETMRAEQRITIVYQGDDGEKTRSLRAVVAVSRPDRFRLRVLGPAGITLVDMVSIGGEVRVLQAIRGVSGGTKLGTLVMSMAADLAASYDLRPLPRERTVTTRGSEVVIVEPGRTVRLGAFRGDGKNSYPGHIEITNETNHYRVTIEAGETVLDEALDPELFPAATRTSARLATPTRD